MAKKPRWVIGIDEVGRGPLAGPVMVCAVACPYDVYKKMTWKEAGVVLDDSKKMSEKGREVWAKKALRLKNDERIRYAVSSASATMIDQLGIGACIRLCVARALKKVRLDPTTAHLLLDGGLKAPQEYLAQQTVIRGDGIHKIIALASVIAKVRRDALMKKYHRSFPVYGWDKNKGYGTVFHRRAIKKQGTTVLHRKSFCLNLKIN